MVIQIFFFSMLLTVELYVHIPCEHIFKSAFLNPLPISFHIKMLLGGYENTDYHLNIHDLGKSFTSHHNFYIIMQMLIIPEVLACNCYYSCHHSTTLTVIHKHTDTHIDASMLSSTSGVVLSEDPYS